MLYVCLMVNTDIVAATPTRLQVWLLMTDAVRSYVVCEDAGANASPVNLGTALCSERHSDCSSLSSFVQEESLRKKQEAKKKQQPKHKSSTNDADTADSLHAAAASAGTAAMLPVDASRAAAKSAPDTSTDKGKAIAEDGRSVGSPFACMSTILGWETFHMVHVLWIGLIDLPGKAPEKDWDMQVGVVKPT